MSDVFNAYKKDGFNGMIVAAENNRENFTIAAAVGAGVGLATTLASDRSTLLTGLISAAAGAVYVAGIHSNAEIAMHDSNGINMAVVAGIGFGYTGLVGMVANKLLGEDNSNVSEL